MKIHPPAALLTRCLLLLATLLSAPLQPARAGDRLLGTGGVMQVEGAAGGGIVPWALIAGLGTRDQVGLSAFCTRVSPQDFVLDSCGLAVGAFDRIELSAARQTFDLGTTVPGEHIRLDIAGLKVRVLGDAIYAQDSWIPQVALGIQYKKNRDYGLVPALLGAEDAKGLDYYVSATKLYLAGPFGRSWLLNATVRATRANQLGILGFGGDEHSGYQWMPEASVGVFLHDRVILGAEYRAKPDSLSVFREDDYWDAFVAFIPHKSASLTLAYANLGNVADKDRQRGLYAALQFSY